MACKLTEFDATAAEQHLLFKREGDCAVIEHAESNLDALKHPVRVDHHGFILSVPDRHGVVENNSGDLMNGDVGLEEEDRLRGSGPGIGDVRCKANDARVHSAD